MESRSWIHNAGVPQIARRRDRRAPSSCIAERRGRGSRGATVAKRRHRGRGLRIRCTLRNGTAPGPMASQLRGRGRRPGRIWRSTVAAGNATVAGGAAAASAPRRRVARRGSFGLKGTSSADFTDRGRRLHCIVVANACGRDRGLPGAERSRVDRAQITDVAALIRVSFDGAVGRARRNRSCSRPEPRTPLGRSAQLSFVHIEVIPRESLPKPPQH